MPLLGNLNAERPASRILGLYHVYRLTTGLALLLLITSDLLALSDSTALTYSAWLYLGLNLAAALLMKQPRPHPLLALALLDIVLLLGMFYLAGGTSSGIGSLIVVAVAIANILLRGRIGLFLAAIASLGMIYLTVYLGLRHSAANSQLLQAGTLGALCFAAALLVQGLTRRLQISENLARQRARDVASLEALNALILQRMHTGILVIDAQHLVLLANQQAQKLLGTPPLAGCWLNVEYPELISRLKQWQHNPVRHPDRLDTPAGTSLQPSFSALQPDEGHTLIALEDQSPIAQQAQQLKLASLGRLTASIAHEVRNPLGAISHAAQLLLESEQLDQADRRLAQIIQDQSQRMNLIIENVLQLSRRQQADPQSLELNTWLAQFIQEYRLHLDTTQHLHIDICPQPLFTRMDASQLGQVLTNLVQNGLRYSGRQHAEAQVWLRLQRDPHTDLPLLEVLDDGPGVPSEQVQHIFEPFFTTDTKGTGLGLYLCRELCESNQAHIDYQERSSGGSCFRIIFAHPGTIS